MKQEQRVMVYSIVAGIVLGLLAKYILAGSVYNLIIWTVAGVTIGYFSKTIRNALLNGFLFGFFVSFFFMVHGYTGTTPVVTRFIPFGALGVFGGACGIVLGIIGNYSRKLLKKN